MAPFCFIICASYLVAMLAPASEKEQYLDACRANDQGLMEDLRWRFPVFELPDLEADHAMLYRTIEALWPYNNHFEAAAVAQLEDYAGEALGGLEILHKIAQEGQLAFFRTILPLFKVDTAALRQLAAGEVRLFVGRHIAALEAVYANDYTSVAQDVDHYDFDLMLLLALCAQHQGFMAIASLLTQTVRRAVGELRKAGPERFGALAQRGIFRLWNGEPNIDLISDYIVRDLLPAQMRHLGDHGLNAAAVIFWQVRLRSLAASGMLDGFCMMLPHIVFPYGQLLECAKGPVLQFLKKHGPELRLALDNDIEPDMLLSPLKLTFRRIDFLADCAQRRGHSAAVAVLDRLGAVWVSAAYIAQGFVGPLTHTFALLMAMRGGGYKFSKAEHELVRLSTVLGYKTPGQAQEEVNAIVKDAWQGSPVTTPKFGALRGGRLTAVFQSGQKPVSKNF